MLISQIDGMEYYFIKSQYLLVLASQEPIPMLTRWRLLLFVEENGSVDSYLFLLLLRWSLLSFSRRTLATDTQPTLIFILRLISPIMYMHYIWLIKPKQLLCSTKVFLWVIFGVVECRDLCCIVAVIGIAVVPQGRGQDHTDLQNSDPTLGSGWQ